MVNESGRTEPPDNTLHYRFQISLRIHHPSADPDRITTALGMTPRRACKAGDARETPSHQPLRGTYRETYWYAQVLAGSYPDTDLNAAIQEVLDRTERFREFFLAIRSEGGRVELSVGWFFERQSGEVLTHTTLAKAADMKIDLSLDVYPPTQP